MMTADQIIDLCGGTSALARSLNRTPSTVSSWREANFIPDWWQGAVSAAADAKGVEIKIDDFPAKDARKTRKKATAA